MSYGLGHTSSTSSSKCVICGKVTSTYINAVQYQKDEARTLNTEIVIPVCDGSHFDMVSSQKEILIAHAKTINTHLKKLIKQEG